jgi:hypothetical protein
MVGPAADKRVVHVLLGFAVANQVGFHGF